MRKYIPIIALISIISLAAINTPPAQANWDKDRIKKSIKYWADHYDMDRKLALSIVEVESQFDTHAISHAGAIGLSQVMPGSAKHHCGIDDPDILRNPNINLECGFKIFDEYFSLAHGNISKALSYYNCGPAGAKKHPKTCAKYALLVMKSYSRK